MTLSELAQEISQNLKIHLISEKASVSGSLLNFQTEISYSSHRYQVIISVPEHFDYLDKGVNGLQHFHGSPYSFRNDIPSRSMVDAVEKWIRVKPLVPSAEQQSIPVRSRAYAVAKSIKRKGIEPRNFLTDTLREMDPEITKFIGTLAEEISYDVLSVID